MGTRRSVIGRLAVVTVAVIGSALWLTVPSVGAQDSGGQPQSLLCQSLTNLLGRTTDPGARQVLLDQLESRGCSVPSSTSTSTTGPTSSTTTTVVSTSTTSTTPSTTTTTTTADPTDSICAVLLDRLSGSNEPAVQAFVQALLERYDCVPQGG